MRTCARGLWFPVDVSTSAQATLGGMAGNNSCGSRSIATETWCTTCSHRRVTRAAAGASADDEGAASTTFVARLLSTREKSEIEARFPKVAAQSRRLQPRPLGRRTPTPRTCSSARKGSSRTPSAPPQALAHPPKRALGVCHFPKFYTAMQLTQHIVKLGPSAGRAGPTAR
jgi:hypothetical protein